MDAALATARFVLAAVFAVAGVAKLSRPSSSRQAAGDFGVPAPLVPTVAVIVPAAELLAAGLLISETTARAGAVLGLLLLGTFSVAMAVNLRRGRRPDCHCFGQVHSRPIGASSLVRNAVLGALALVVAAAGGGATLAQVGSWLADAATPSMVVALAALALAGVEGRLVAGLLRQQGRLLLRLERLEADAEPEPEGLPVGTTAPEFELVALDGRSHRFEALPVAPSPLVLVFTSPSCGPCQALVPELARWQHDLADRLRLVVVTDRRPAGEELAGLADPLLDDDDAVARSFRISATPSAVLIGVDGTVAAPLAVGREAIQHLVVHASPAPASTLSPNGDTPHPEVLDGQRG